MLVPTLRVCRRFLKADSPDHSKFNSRLAECQSVIDSSQMDEGCIVSRVDDDQRINGVRIRLAKMLDFGFSLAPRPEKIQFDLSVCDPVVGVGPIIKSLPNRRDLDCAIRFSSAALSLMLLP